MTHVFLLKSVKIFVIVIVRQGAKFEKICVCAKQSNRQRKEKKEIVIEVEHKLRGNDMHPPKLEFQTACKNLTEAILEP